MRPLGTLLAAALVAATLPAVTATSAADGAPAATRSKDRPAVIGRRVLGKSVKGRPIRAWHLGEKGEKRVVLIATMHGNEPRPRRILYSLRDGRPIRGINLWVVPVYNPDGLARHTRKNAHGVDLNRNYPYKWADLDGSYESGPKAKSEPETRAMMTFLRDVKPAYVLSFHQPLHAVDTDMKRPKWARKVARTLNLPTRKLDCGGVCHGTMTAWYNHRFRGAAVTVEYGANPTKRRMRVGAPRQVLKLFGAHRVKG